MVSVAFDVAYDRILHQDIELENSISEVTLSFFFFFYVFFFFLCKVQNFVHYFIG